MLRVQGWVLEQCCPAIADILEGVNLSEAVALPSLHGMSANEAYQAFSLLVEFAYTGTVDIPAAQAAATWAMASCFGYALLKV